MLAIVLLLVVSAAWALLLRWTRCPGWSVLGGVAAGLLLGPTILGRVAPDLYGSVFDGGVEERRVVRETVSRHGVERAASRHAGATFEAMDRLRLEQEAALDVADEAWRDARWAHQGPQRTFVAILVALTLAGASAFAVKRDAARPSIIATLSVGAWSAALPGVVAWLAVRVLWDGEAGETMLVVAAIAIGPWALTASDREAADRAESGGARLVQTAGRVATLFAVVLAAVALLVDHGAAGRPWIAALAAAPAGWLLGRLVSGEAFTRGVLRFVVVPAITAAVAVRIDLLADFKFWPAVLLALLSSDGRWMGAFTGAQILGGRRGMRTMLLVMGSSAAGPTQIAVTAVALATWSIDASLALALLAGAVLIDVTGPARRGVAARLSEAE